MLKKNLSKVEDLKAAMQETKARLDKAQASRDAAVKRRDEVDGERKQFIIPARVDKDSDAQQALKGLDQEAEGLTRDIADDDVAIRILSEKMASYETDLGDTEWDLQCDRVARLVANRARGVKERNFEEALKRLVQLSDEMRAEDEEIGLAMRQLHPSLFVCAGDVARAGEKRKNLASCILDRAGVVDALTNWTWKRILEQQDFFTLATSVYEAPKKAIDQLRQQKAS